VTTVMSFKDVVDLPEWRALAVAPVAAGAGVSMACDLRNSEVRDPHIFEFEAAASFAKYNTKNDEWLPLSTPATVAIAAGSCAVFVPSWGPYGILTGTHTTLSVTLGTALPGAVGVNSLANRGDGVGFKVRIINKVTGKTAERTIVANTAGTTPILYLDSALPDAPNDNDLYEFLSGAVLLIGSGASPTLRKHDVATGVYSTVSNTNFIATVATDGILAAMDEQYVPHDKNPGEGFFGVLTATGSGNTSLTGQATGGDVAVLANEYRNFQLRIVEDTDTPAAVGQRRKITSHTAGASPVYSVAAWDTTPSTDAKYVVEMNNDILAWNGALAVTYSKLAGFNADAAWSTAAVAGGATQYANPPVANAAGCMVFPSWGITPDTNKNARHSFFFRMRGAAAALGPIDLFDVAGAANGLWTSDVAYGNKGGFLATTGSSSVYNPSTNDGRYSYLSQNGTQRFARFDAKNRCLEPWAYMRYPQSTVTVGGKTALAMFIDPDDSTKIAYLVTRQQAGLPVLGVLIQR